MWLSVRQKQDEFVSFDGSIFRCSDERFDCAAGTQSCDVGFSLSLIKDAHYASVLSSKAFFKREPFERKIPETLWQDMRKSDQRVFSEWLNHNKKKKKEKILSPLFHLCIWPLSVSFCDNESTGLVIIIIKKKTSGYNQCRKQYLIRQQSSYLF